jgi:hypothetical protein
LVRGCLEFARFGGFARLGIAQGGAGRVQKWHSSMAQPGIGEKWASQSVRWQQ